MHAYYNFDSLFQTQDADRKDCIDILDPGCLDEFGNSLLHHALICYDQDIVDFIIQICGKNVQGINKLGQTVLHVCAQQEKCHPEMAGKRD